MRRFFLSLTIGVIFLLTISNVFSQADESNSETLNTVRFAVIGDRTGGAVPGIYEQIVEEIERMKPDFVITVGDMIEGPENDEERLRNKWTEYLSIVAHLSMPIYYTPGNNDIETDFMEPFYREYIGQPYHSFNYRSIHIIVIDNSRWSSSNDLPQEQMDWIKNDLEKNADAKQSFVFCHKPFWETTVADANPDSLHYLFKKYGVDAVFSGHYHKYFSGLYDNILYTNVGSSGAGIAGPGPTGLEHHFVWVTVDDKTISIAPIKMGAVLPWDEVTAEENKFINNAQNNCISFSQPFLFSPAHLSGADSYEVVLKNYSQEFRLEDTIQWDVPYGWFVEPSQMAVSIGADSSKSYNFVIKSSKPLYPLPTISLNFPYALGKTAKTTNDLPVARKTICHKAGKKPKIDGVISDKIWQSPVTELLGYDGAASKTDSVKFYFAYDDNYLYLASYCVDSDIKSIITQIREHDGAVYGDDCVGYILQPDSNKDEMYLIYVNSNGYIFDQKMEPNAGGYFESDESWDCEYKIKTKIGENYWSMEIKLPLAQFGATIKKDNFWGLNMRRKQPRLNDAAHWQIPWRYGPEFLGRLIIK